MKFRMACVVAALVVSAVGLAAAQASVAGKWSLSVQFDQGSGTPAVVFQQDGEKLSGTYSGQMGEFPLEGTLKDGKIAFVVKINMQGTELELLYSGTVESATTMKGTVDLGGMGSGTWTGKKAE